MARRRYNFDLAGQAFGFELPAVTEENGEAKTESVLTDYFPELKFTFGSKTQRGGRLGRSATQVTPEVTMRQKEAATLGGGGPITVSPTFTNTVTAPSTPATTPVAETKKSFSWSENLGGPGFGAMDYEAALKQGFTDADITSYIVKNQGMFGPGKINLAEDLQKKFGLPYSYVNPQVQADVVAGKYGTPAGQTMIQQPPAPAPAAAPTPKFENPLQTQEFRAAPSAPETPSATRAPISAAYGIDPSYFGGEDVKAAKAQGYTESCYVKVMCVAPPVACTSNSRLQQVCNILT